MFAPCTDAVVEVLPAALVLLVLLAPLSVLPGAAPPFHGRNIGPLTGMPIGPFDAVVPVGEPAEAVPLPLRSAAIDFISCNNPPPRPLVLTVPEPPVAAELPVVFAPAAAVLLAGARLPPMSEIIDCRLAKRSDIRLPGPVSPAGRAVDGTAGGPLGKPTPADPALAEAPLAPSPDMLPNDSNCDNRPLDSVGKAPPAIALPNVPVAEEPAENGVAVVAADPLLWLA